MKLKTKPVPSITSNRCISCKKRLPPALTHDVYCADCRYHWDLTPKTVQAWETENRAPNTGAIRPTESEPVIGSSEFSAREFCGQFTTHSLIAAITTDGIKIPRASSELESLNKLLDRRSLHFKFKNAAQFSIKNIEVALKYEELSDLNRSILEAAYPLQCPKRLVFAHERTEQDRLPHSSTRESAMRWLLDNRLARDEAELVLLICFDHFKRVRELAKASDKGRTWVSTKLRNPAIKVLVEKLRTSLKKGETLPPVEADMPAAALPSQPSSLDTCASTARCMLDPANTENANEAKCKLLASVFGSYWHLVGVKSPGAVLRDRVFQADQIIAAIRRCPALLLDDEYRVLREALVDLLEAAFFGQSARRVRGVLPTWDLPFELPHGMQPKQRKGQDVKPKNNNYPAKPRRLVADHAVTALNVLIKQNRGKQFTYDESTLKGIVELFRERVVTLQEKWQNTIGGGTRDGRLQRFRKQHGKEFLEFSDKEMFEILTGDPFRVSLGLAEKETLLSADAYRRACRKLPPI